MSDIDYSILQKGFKVSHNNFVDFYYAISVNCNEEGDYQFCTKEFKDSAERLVDFLNNILEDKKQLEKENKKLKRENEYLNSEAIRLHKEVYCMDCFTCRHSESINIDVKCAEGEKEYHCYCDFYEIEEEWQE